MLNCGFEKIQKAAILALEKRSIQIGMQNNSSIALLPTMATIKMLDISLFENGKFKGGNGTITSLYIKSSMILLNSIFVCKTFWD